MAMRITVIFPLYYPDLQSLERAVNGVLNQRNDGPEFEYVFIDDSGLSYDSSHLLAMLNSYGIEYKFIKNTNTHGLAGCWNSAVSNASFEYIHFVHQDDVVHEGFYKCIMGLFNLAKCVFYATRSNYIDKNNFVFGVSPIIGSGEVGSLQSRDLFYNTPIQCSATVINKDVFIEIGGFENNYCYLLDRHLLLRLSVKGSNLISNHIFTSYRFSDSNETSRLEKQGKIFNDYLLFREFLLNEKHDFELNSFNRKFYEWANGVRLKYINYGEFEVANEFHLRMKQYFSSFMLIRYKVKGHLISVISKI
jgi:hypothetical protein